jgi:alkylation response protein AidB-like acyl-CoA dehydrogenase
MDFELTKEQHDIVRAAREFAVAEFPNRAQEFDREEKFDYDIWKKACALGFTGINIKEEYGGGGFGMFELCLVTEEFWAVEPGIACAIFTTFGADQLEMYGTEEQKRQYLPPLASGSAIMGTAITEPDAGSDVTGVATAATRDGDEYVINGSKMFTSNGTVASYLSVFCQTDPGHDDRHKRHSFFLVETNRKGFQANKLKGKLGVRAADTAEVIFSDVRVPVSNLLGQEGKGFEELMTIFDRTRIMVSSQAVGTARGALGEAIDYSKKRHQFGKPLRSFQGIQFKLAEMATMIEAARSLYYQAAWKIDRDTVDPKLIAMAKWFAGETAVKCADECLQIHGGYGYFDDYKIHRIYRDAKVLEIWEGTKEIEKIIIARRLARI